MITITAAELAPLLQQTVDQTVIDVRSPEEFALGSIPGAINIPTSSVLERIDEFKRTGSVYIICHSGTRSRLVTLTLEAQGLKNIINVSDGMKAWQALPAAA